MGADMCSKCRHIVQSIHKKTRSNPDYVSVKINLVYVIDSICYIFRRYGVVESRFCFEGGSRCGKGEGLYVLVTDQGEEITKTFRLAAEGKLMSKKRPASRNASGNLCCNSNVI